MDRDNKAGGKRTCNELERTSLKPVLRPPVIGWLCCGIIEELRQHSNRFITHFHSGFIPLAIFRDRLTALLYAYSLSTPQKQENKHFKIFIEDGTKGYEDPPHRAAAPRAGMSRAERKYVERLKAKICEADFHYEGAENNCKIYSDGTISDIILVFPLRVMNPPMDTISPHVKLTCAICPASKGVVISKCEGSDNRQHSRYMPSEYSRLVCECEVEYFPFGIPYLFSSKKFSNRLSTCLARNYPDATYTNEIPTKLARHVASFLPIELIIGFLKLPVERRAATEEEFKQHIFFSLPKRIATSFETPGFRARYDFRGARGVNANDCWELSAKCWGCTMKYVVNDIPEDANWSSLGIVVCDDSENCSLRRVVGFLRNRIPSKYLSEGSKCVVDLLVISKDEITANKYRYGVGNLHATNHLKLEFYDANGSKHCDWYLFKTDLHGCILLEKRWSEFLQNSTIVHLKDSAWNSNGESDELGLADVEINNLASYLLTAYDHNIGINCDSNRDEASIISSAPLSIAELGFKQLPSVHSQNVSLLLNETLMDVSNWTLRQLWTKVANLFQISNFSFINHQEQTTPVNTPTDLVVLTDYIPDTDRTSDENYSTCILNSALATAYRNNSNCLKAFQSFDVSLVVLNIGRFGRYSKGEVREVSHYLLKMSTDHMCEICSRKIFYRDDKSFFPMGVGDSNENPNAYYSSHDRQDGLLFLFDALASLGHRPAQVECWDRGRDYPPFRNPFGFVPEPSSSDDVVFTYEHNHKDRPDPDYYSLAFFDDN